MLLRPTARSSKRYHLVENQQNPQFRSDTPHPFQKFRIGRNHAALTVDRLDYHRRQLIRVIADDPLRSLQIVVRHDHNLIR